MRGAEGAATLLVTLVLMTAATLFAFMAARAVAMEQRIAGNDYRAKEVAAAAEGGLEFGVAWLATRRPAWRNLGAGDEVCREAVAEDDAHFDLWASLPVPTLEGFGTEEFSVELALCRRSDQPEWILLMARAVSLQDPELRAVARGWISPIPLLARRELPPLVLGGCLQGVRGRPELFPDTRGVAMEAPSEGQGCVEARHLELHGGAVAQGPPPSDLWESLFNVTRDEFADFAKREEEAVAAGRMQEDERALYWIEGDWEIEHDLGTPDHPVAVVFAHGCPRFSGGVTITGLLYLGADGSPCPARGWGGFTLHGTLVSGGDLEGLNANVELRPFAWVAGGPLAMLLPAVGAERHPGSWRDY